jgi:hypothetical protein
LNKQGPSWETTTGFVVSEAVSAQTVQFGYSLIQPLQFPDRLSSGSTVLAKPFHFRAVRNRLLKPNIKPERGAPRVSGV